MRLDERTVKRSSGFTLVELAIVLVIVGLLAGGILAGNALIKEAEIRSVITDIGKYKSAYNTFQAKYDALPGDMRNATDIWGSYTDNGGACPPANGSTLVGTCDGDADGIVGSYTGHTTTAYESFTTWQQLSLAGLIPGVYSGASTAAVGNHAKPGVNVPFTRIIGVGFSTKYMGQFIATGSVSGSFSGDYAQVFFVGAEVAPASSGQTRNAGFTPEQASQIDLKWDDGMPGSGFVRADLYPTISTPSLPPCLMYISDGTPFTDALSPQLATYNVANPLVACSIIVAHIY